MKHSVIRKNLKRSMDLPILHDPHFLLSHPFYQSFFIPPFNDFANNSYLLKQGGISYLLKQGGIKLKQAISNESICSVLIQSVHLLGSKNQILGRTIWENIDPISNLPWKNSILVIEILIICHYLFSVKTWKTTNNSLSTFVCDI